MSGAPTLMHRRLKPSPFLPDLAEIVRKDHLTSTETLYQLRLTDGSEHIFRNRLGTCRQGDPTSILGLIDISRSRRIDAVSDTSRNRSQHTVLDN